MLTNKIKNNLEKIVLSKTIFIIILLIFGYFRESIPIIDTIVFPYFILPWAAIFLYVKLTKGSLLPIYNTNLLTGTLAYYVFLIIYHFIIRRVYLPPALDDIYYYASLFYVCYPNEDDNISVEKSMKIFSMAFIVFVSYLSVLGLIYTYNFELFNINEICYAGVNTYTCRLYLFAYPNTSALMCCFAILLTVYCFINTRNIAIRVLYLLISIINYIAMSLTQTRTAMFIFYISFGMVLVFGVLSNKKIKNILIKIALSSIAFVVSIAICLSFYDFCVSTYTNKLANKLAYDRNMQVTNQQTLIEDNSNKQANTEISVEKNANNIAIPISVDNVKDELTIRKINDGLSTFSNRTVIWTAAFNAVKNNPNLLIGTLNDAVMTHVNKYMDSPVNLSIHNSYINILIVGGIPSFILLLLFIVKTLPKQLVYIFSDFENNKNGKRIFPIIVIGLLIVGTMESALIYSMSVFNTLLFIIMGYSVHISNSKE